MDSKEIVYLGVAIALAGIMIPIGLTQIYAANTTGWDAAVITMFTVVLPIAAIVGLVIKFIM